MARLHDAPFDWAGDQVHFRAPNSWSGWEVNLLHRGVWVNNQSTRDFLTQWGRGEESQAINNPLNTKRACCGGVDHPGLGGVKDYPSHAQGIEATYGAITNGLYPTIVAYLATGGWNLTIATDPRNGRLNAELATWGTTNYQPGGKGGYTKPGATPGHATDTSTSDWTSASLDGVPAPPGGWLLAFPWLVGPIEGIAAFFGQAGDLWKVFAQFFTVLIWLLQPKHWVQMLEVLAGSVLIVLGLNHLMKVFSGSEPFGGIKRAASSVARVAK